MGGEEAEAANATCAQQRRASTNDTHGSQNRKGIALRPLRDDTLLLLLLLLALVVVGEAGARHRHEAQAGPRYWLESGVCGRSREGRGGELIDE